MHTAVQSKWRPPGDTQRTDQDVSVDLRHSIGTFSKSPSTFLNAATTTGLHSSEVGGGGGSNISLLFLSKDDIWYYHSNRVSDKGQSSDHVTLHTTIITTALALNSLQDNNRTSEQQRYRYYLTVKQP